MSSRKLFNITDFGATPNTSTLATEAIQKAIDACAEAGGGTVYVEGGIFISGTIRLKSRCTLHIEKNSTLQCSTNPSDTRYFQSQTVSRMDVKPWRAFIFAENEHDIALCGEGTIDGAGDHENYWDDIENSPDRPYGIHCINCTRVSVSDLTLRNSAFWMQRYLNCTQVRITNVAVWNHANRNNDGMDIDSCEDVIISGCFVDSSDDGICLKSEGERPCGNVTISNCNIGTHASAIKMGTASVGGFENITISNCVIRKSRSETMKHPLKAWGGLAGIDLGNVDGGVMRNIAISNITIDGVESPVFIRLGNRLSGSVDRQGYGGEDGTKASSNEAQVSEKGTTSNIVISNITSQNSGPHSSIISGYAGNHIEDLTIRDCIFSAGKAGTREDAAAECNWTPNVYPCNRSVANGTAMPVFGMYIRHVDRLVLDNVVFKAAADDPRLGVVVDTCREPIVNNVRIIDGAKGYGEPVLK